MTALQTSGTTDFNLSLAEIAEEAWERAGMEIRSGYDMRTTRRSLGLLLLEWANKGVNMWTIDGPTSIPLISGTASYNIPVDTVDLFDHYIRTGTGTSQQDLAITRISESTYSTIPNKNALGRPIQVWINRQSGATNNLSVVQYPTITVWPIPDVATTYTFVYYRLRRIQDAGNGMNGQDIPFRFLPVLVAGLAYHISQKIPLQDGLFRIPRLKQAYDELWDQASSEDREKASTRLVPRQTFLGTS